MRAKQLNKKVETQWVDGLEVERVQCTFEERNGITLRSTSICSY